MILQINNEHVYMYNIYIIMYIYIYITKERERGKISLSNVFDTHIYKAKFCISK